MRVVRRIESRALLRAALPTTLRGGVPVSLRSVLLVAMALFAFGCSSKRGVVEPDPTPLPPPLPEGVGVAGNVVSWTTETESRGSVRYGFGAESLDHMAYPEARNRGDRALTHAHVVPLLDVSAGQTVYVQVMNEIPGREAGVSETGAFVATKAAPAALLTSTMIHIGFGDCHLVTMPNGTQMLVDGGERDAETAVRTYMQQHGIASLRAMLATHVHIDHLGSFVGDSFTNDDGMLTFLRPQLFFDSPSKSFNRDAYFEAVSTAAGAGIQRLVVARGQSSEDTPELAFDPNVRVLVLSSGTPPDYTSSGHDNTDINNDSIVLKFSYGDVDFIIGGDAEQGAEQSMLNAFTPAELEVEYYKAHHHGLPDASSATWVSALRPRVCFVPNTQAVWSGDLRAAIASTTSSVRALGAHVYAIDDAESLDRPRGSGIQYNVTFATDGRSYEVRLEQATQPTPRKAAQLSACMLEARTSRVPDEVDQP